MSLGKKLLRSSFVRTSQMFLQVVVAIIMTPIIVHSLGDRMYGFWVLVGTFLGYYGLLDFGLSSAVARFMSRADGQNDIDEANRVINTALVIFSLVGTAVLIMSVLASMLCGYFIHDAAEAVMFSHLILLLGTSMAFGFPMRVFGGVLDSHMRHDMTSYSSVIRLLAANASIWYLLKAGYGIYALAVVSFIGGMAEYAMLYFFARRVMPSLVISRGLFDRAMVRKMFGYSSKTFVAQLANILRFKVDALVIAACLNVSLITHYSVGARLNEYFTQIMTSAVGMLAPVFSRQEGRGDYAAIRRSLLFATKLSVMLSVFIGMSIMFYGKPFIQRWMGAGFEDSSKIAAILAGGYIFALMQVPSLNMLYGISKHHYFAAINICEGLLNLAASLILVRYYGMYGVALGTVVGMVVIKIFVQPYFVCRTIEQDLIEYYRYVCLWIFESAVPVAAFMYIIRSNITADYPSIFVYGLLQAVLFATFGYIIILTVGEKDAVRRMFRKG